MKQIAALVFILIFLNPFLVSARSWPDPLFVNQDYLDDINIYPYDFKTAGDGLVVALIGDGVQSDHLDYADNYLGGWDFINDSTQVTPNGPYDTAVAGIIAATADIKGTIGIAPKALIMSLVVCDASTCYEDLIAPAIEYAVANGADVIVLTLGSVGGVLDYSSDFDNAIEYAYQNDVLVVAGMEPETDENGEEVAMSLGCNDVGGKNMVIGVGSVDDYEDIDLNCIDALAPTVDILVDSVGEFTRMEDAVETMSGLPLGIGMVAGIGALARDAKKYLSVAEIIAQIVEASEDGVIDGQKAAYASHNIKLNDVSFSTVYTGQSLRITGDDLNPRLRFRLANESRSYLLDEVEFISTSELKLRISENVESGTYYLRLENYSKQTNEFEVINLGDFENTVSENTLTTVEEPVEVQTYDLSDFAVAVAGDLAERLAGYILLQVEQKGEAWYLSPTDSNRYYLQNGGVAYELMRSLGLGITSADLSLIPKSDELTARESASVCDDYLLANDLRGRILLQVEERGEAWYVDPATCLRIYMKDGDAAYEIMKYLSLGITDADLSSMSD